MSRIWRTLKIPDPVRIKRGLSAPELGPKILFFSGGSALNKLSRELKNYTHNSIHLVTSFDSGGSSAKLRDEFSMPAVGDLRSRLMALADESVLGQPDVYNLFNYRLSKNKAPDVLKDELNQLRSGQHELMVKINQPLRQLIQTQLSVTYSKISTDFDLRGASIGNLIIAGGYLNNEQQLDPIVFLFSRLVKVLGEVQTITDSFQHLIAVLENDQLICGQDKLTGKETHPINSPVKEMYLSASLDPSQRMVPYISEDRKKTIQEADLICYPPGSFYSSVLVNLLPEGVAQAILNNQNPKVYVPNLGEDPEQYGMNIFSQVTNIICYVKGENAKDSSGALDFLLLDKNTKYEKADLKQIEDLGVTILQRDLISINTTRYDNKKLTEALISFI